MTEKKWTEGPWEIEADEDSCTGAVYIGRVDHRGIMVEAVCRVYGEHEAYLIAAAPELYEALEGLAFGGTERQYREMMNDAPCHNGITDIEGCSRCGRELKAIRALSKARGES